MGKTNEPRQMVWDGNIWRLCRGIREIRRGKKKGKHEVKYLKGRRIKKIIVPESNIRLIGV